MSGGSMDYLFSRVNEAASCVLEFLKEIEAEPDNWIETPEGRRLELALENYGDKAEFKSKETVQEGCRKRLWDAYTTLRKAAIYAQRAEWWQSCDDGSLNFIGRTDEELEALEKEVAEIRKGNEKTPK